MFGRIIVYEDHHSYSAGSRRATARVRRVPGAVPCAFHASEGRHALDRYLTGLLTELPNKNCDTIAASIPGTSEQQLQGLLSTTAWDQDDLNRQRVEQMLRLPSEGDGVLIFDDTGFAKQGKCSVGVARQYSGTLGKKR